MKNQNLQKRKTEQALIDTIRNVQRKKAKEQRIQISLRDKKINDLFKYVKKEITRKQKNYHLLSNRLKKGVERYLIVELHNFKNIDSIEYKQLESLIKRSLYLIRKTKFYELYKTKKISKKQARQELYKKLKEYLSVTKLSRYDKKKIGTNMNKWLKENNGSGSLTFNEYSTLEEYVFSNLSEVYKERLYHYNTEQIINSFFNKSNIKRMFKRRTKESILEIKTQFKEYIEKKYKQKEIPEKDLKKLEMVLFKIIIKH